MADTKSQFIFICFTGPDSKLANDVVEMSSGYECWNLKKFTLDAFISALQAKIPPINKNLVNNYRANESEANPDHGIKPKEFGKCSWGLLLPAPPEALVGLAETLFLLNLYSPHFLYPPFYATDLGIWRPQQPKERFLYFHDQNQAQRFTTKSFVHFHQALLPQCQYASWRADLVSHWKDEDWRLFVACLLYSEQRQYENSKQVFGWQRESADLATILEALFTAESNGDNTEIGYRLRKRIAVLLAPHIPDIEKQVKALYKQRSAFVHGSFFQSIRKDIKVTNGLAELPHPQFQFLYVQKENVRIVLVAYLYLDKLVRSSPKSFGGCTNVLQLLENAIIDKALRQLVEMRTGEILGLLFY